MVDLVFDGCISLADAYARFALQLWNGHPPVADLGRDDIYRHAYPIAETCRASLNVTERMRDDFARAFTNGSLDAFVRFPGATENSAIPEEAWRIAIDPRSVFLNAEITSDSDGRLSAFAGRTPFTSIDRFEAWLAAQVARKSDPNAPQSPAVRALTEHLIELARYGLLSSMQVEEFAARWGLQPFASEPDGNAFHPLKLSHWTLAMTVAWIAWGKVDNVRNTMDDYCSKCWSWVPFVRSIPTDDGTFCEVKCEELKAGQPDGMWTLRMLELGGQDHPGPDKRLSVGTAIQQLWSCLAEGTIKATGLDRAGQYAVIAPHEWTKLALSCGANADDMLIFPNDTGRPAYSDVTIPRAVVLESWPGLSDGTLSQLPHRRRSTERRPGSSSLAALSSCSDKGSSATPALSSKLPRAD